MSEDRLAALIKTKECLEIHVFLEEDKSDASLNAFTRFENKILIKKISFKESIKTPPMIAQDFSNIYPKFHKDNNFNHLGGSSYCKYHLSLEKELLVYFNEYFSEYKNSL